jgi:uncharacterized CHY-type Zn-finger protein
MKMNGIEVKGINVDRNTRCGHYSTEKDIIAIKFKCCDTYYSCHSCHDEVADHPSILWKIEERNTKAILCGACGTELTIQEYMDCNSVCPNCKLSFNGGCKSHYHLYFE